jgi:pyridinium-3,5-bisthiocarboxylic acid mononucleotide nickel chelatase
VRILYFDCFSGLSGDMALGALVDAGLPLEDLRGALGSLALGDAHVHAHRVLRAGVSATKFTVHQHRHEGGHDQAHEHAGSAGDAHPHEHGNHPHRSLVEIFHLIDHSNLPPQGRARAKAMFQRLGEAEAAIHGTSIDTIHLHEVGALDSIIDIVGIVYAMEWANADRVVCSPLNVGGGMVQSAHGVFPVPAPATVTLLGDAPVYSGRVQSELVTPTGALIATTYASEFGPLPAMSIERVGYGAGDRDDPVTPNVVRVLIGRAADAPRPGDRVTVIECEIDDMNPQIFGVVMDRLYAAGALEVFYTPVQMKKNRPGTLLTVVAAPERRAAMSDIVFAETTTIGLRHYDVDRECLQREIVRVETPIGAVRFKIARRDGRVVNATPEFEDCAALAREKHLPVKDVQAMAIAAYGARG